MRLFLSILILHLSKVLATQVPTVEIENGNVSGVLDKSFSGFDYFAYMGIPYAESPTDDLRFQLPVPKKPWNGIWDGSKNGKPCLQLMQFKEPEIIGSEDCLWLNVYTPNIPKSKSEKLKPVLVWIYGGRFLVGSASSKTYSPNFMLDHDIVMVSIQYRVGPYGFLSTGDAAAPGNYGLHDQVLALKWIQANIAKFGGDPDQVTISGHSAGSASTHLHMISPKSRGLFSKSISLSGTAANYWAGRADTHKKYAKVMGVNLGCPTEDSYKLIECLKKVDPMVLTQAQWKTHDMFHKNPAKLPLSTFIPRIDKEAEDPFMPESPLELLRQGEFENLPWMTGVTSQEGAWFTSTLYGQDSMEFLKEYDRNEVRATKSLGAGALDEDGKAQKALHFYTQGKPVADQFQRIPFSEFTSDLLFNVECLLAVHIQSRQSHAPIYFYQFNYRGNWTFAHEFEETKHDYQGVAHLDDISYFMMLPSYHDNLNPEEITVMKQFTEFIAEFVTYGKPTHGNRNKKYPQYWRPFKPGHGVSMLIENPPRISFNFPFKSIKRPGRLNFWMREIFEHPEDLESDFRTHDEL